MRHGAIAGLQNVLLVGSGGFIGAVLRYGLGAWVARLLPASRLPWATLVVNVVGCFVIGGLYGLAETRELLGARGRLFLVVGLLGGFTTYSAFGYETFELVRVGHRGGAALYVGAQIFAGLLAVWAGYGLARAG